MYLCFFFQVKVFIEIKVLAGEICKKKKWDFFPGEFEKTKLKKMFLSLKKKIGEKCMCAFFPKLNFFFFREKKCKLLFLLLENSLYLKQSFYVFLSFFFFFPENFHKKLKKSLVFTDSKKNSPRNIFTIKNKQIPASFNNTDRNVCFHNHLDSCVFSGS